MSVKTLPPGESKLGHYWILPVLGAVGFGLIIWVGLQSYDTGKEAIAAQWRADKAQKVTAVKLDDSAKLLDQTKRDRAQSEIKHASEQEFVEGELQVIKQVRPAVLKLAYLTEENVRKQYEAKILSNQKLYEITVHIAKKMRDFSQKYQLQSSRRTHAQMAAMRTATTEGERQRICEKFSRQAIADYYQRQLEFRTSILPDAVYIRNELLRRGLREPPPNPRMSPHMVQMVFSGHLVGPYPEVEAADYLEQMAKQLIGGGSH